MADAIDTDPSTDQPSSLDTSKTSRSIRPKQDPAAVRYFLLTYNFISAILWAAVLGRVCLVAAVYGTMRVYFATGEFAQWTQSLAVLEVLFSLTGLVRAPLATTAMQVASRLLLVWGIVYIFPSETAGTSTYTRMLIAWSVTEVVRYSFFTASLYTNGQVPAFLTWLRYNLFFVLYPLGIYSECKLIYNAIPAARVFYPGMQYVLWTILGIYVPGSYVLYSHMMKQRRKVMRTAAAGHKAS